MNGNGCYPCDSGVQSNSDPAFRKVDIAWCFHEYSLKYLPITFWVTFNLILVVWVKIQHWQLDFFLYWGKKNRYFAILSLLCRLFLFSKNFTCYINGTARRIFKIPIWPCSCNQWIIFHVGRVLGKWLNILEEYTEISSKYEETNIIVICFDRLLAFHEDFLWRR